jgi:hypothetical protein
MNYNIPKTQLRIISAILVVVFLTIAITPSLLQAAVPVAGSGKALDFDGTDDIIAIGTLNGEVLGSNPRTIEAWVKTTSTNIGSIFRYGKTAPNGRINLRTGDGQILIEANGKQVVWEALAVNDGNWHHVAWSYSNGTNLSDGIVYVDGIALTNILGNNANVPPNTQTGAAYIGSLDNNFYFDGNIDEVRVWNVTRSQSQIQANMYSPLSGSESGLINYWQFEEGSGTTASDTTSNNNGTLTNMDNSDWVNGIIGNLTFTTKENSPLTGTLSAYDADGDNLTYSIVNNDGGAAVITNANTGAFTYTPTTSGTRTFTYKVNDGLADSNIATVTVTVTSLVVDSIGDTEDGDYSTGQNTLREAIANASAGDTITFDPSIAGQTIRLSNQLSIAKNLTIDGTGQNVTISGDTDNDGTGDVSIFYIPSNVNVTIDSLTFDKANTTGTPYSGAIQNKGNLTISNSLLSNNRGSSISGAIYNDYKSLVVNNCTFSNNIFSGFGASIENLAGTVIVNDSSFSGNSAASGGSVIRGGWGTVTLNNITAFNNSGSAFSRLNTTININNSTIANNNDEAFDLSSNGTTTIKNTTISGNKKGIVNKGTLHLLNTIVANSTNIDCENSGTIATNTNNLIENGNCIPAVNDDPNLGSLQDNGGSTQTMALLPNSLAINAGDNTACLATDQRGITRPQNTTCDIGAYEKRAPAFTSTPIILVNVNDAYSYSITTIDNEPTDGVSPAIRVPTKPAWLTLTDNGNGTGTLNGTSTPAYVGTNNVTLRLNDGTENIDQPFVITVNKLNQTISFSSLDNKIYGDPNFTVSASTSSSLPVNLEATGACLISGNSVSLVGIGDCTITASQGGNDTYNAATNVMQSFNIAAPPQSTISYELMLNKIGNGFVSAEGINCGSDCSQFYNEGASITLIVIPASNWLIAGFSGDCSSATVLMDADKSCTVIFKPRHSLTITVKGQGKVDDCGTSCSQIHPDGETINLITTAEKGWALDNFSGDCDKNGTVTMDSDKSCTATFIEGYYLTIDVVTGKGKVKTATQECQENCQEVMASNSTTTLIAEPEVEWVFEGWSGDCDAQGKVDMSSEKTCTAIFVEDPNIPNDGDGNGDGVKDVDQPHIVSMPDANSGEYLTMEFDDGVNVTDIYSELAEDKGPFDDSLNFPQGIVYFELDATKTDVTLYYHGVDYAFEPTLQKYGAKTPGDANTIGWYTLPDVTFDTATIATKTVVTAKYHLKDGELGDNTGVDGRIIDPVGLTTSKQFDNIISLISKTTSASTQAGFATLTVTRMGLKGNVSVNYATANGTAIAGQDYQATSGTLTWANGEREDKIITIPILSGASTGKALTVTLTNLVVSESQTAVLGLDTMAVNLSSNIIGFAAANQNISIQAGKTDLIVSRSGIHNDVSVDYTTVNDTAIANTDYQPLTGTLLWKDGDNADKTISIELLDGAMIDKTLNVVLSNPSVTDFQSNEEGILVLDIDTVAVTITGENVINEKSVIGFTSRGYSALKNGVATITVKRSGDIQSEVSVNYGTIDATAFANQDYQATEGTLSWANGETGAKTFSVTLLEGATLGNSLLVNLDDVSGAKMDVSMAVLTIREESKDEPTIDEPPSTADEDPNQDILADVTTNPGEVISNVTLQGEINNQATLQDVNIALDTTVTGGKLDGTIISDGAIKDVTTAPTAVIYGGYAGGTVYNEGTLVAITVEEGAVISGGVLIGPIKNKGTIKDAILKGSISGGNYDGVVVNRGLLATANIVEGATVIGGLMTGSSTNNGTIVDTTITNYAKVSGGQYFGEINNQGTLANATILPGATVTGGTMDGNINSQGALQDVELTEGVQLRGGKLTGKISGDPDKPAQIGAAEIAPNTKLTNVRLSPTVQLPDDIVLGSGVILPAEPPTSEDFGLATEEIAELDAERITELEPEVFGTLDAETVETIPAEAFEAVGPQQLASLEKESVEGVTTEQFEEMPIEALEGLTSENMGGLPTDIVEELMPEHLTALDKDEFQAMPSKDVSKLFTNLNSANVTPQNVEELLPPGWELNPRTGALDAPVGAELSFQNLPASDELPSQVKLPTTANLNSGLGIDGSGPTLLEGSTRSLEEANLADFVLSQGENGILLVEGTGDSAGITFTFIPDVDNAIQVDTDKTPIGLNVGNGGFYTITTPEGEQYKVVPAPHDPVALSEAIGGKVVLGKRGDTMLEREAPTRRGKTREVLIFDPFIEPGIDDSCVEIVLGEFDCDEFDDLRSGKRGLRQRIQTRKIKYPDGTAQTIRPTVLSPDVFIEEGSEFEGVENVVYNANGTFYVAFEGKSYLIIPNFEVGGEEVPEGKSVEPSININEGQLRYTIPIETSEEDNRRRGKTREVLIFDPFIEPAPDDMCMEPVPGEIVCDFDE